MRLANSYTFFTFEKHRCLTNGGRSEDKNEEAINTEVCHTLTLQHNSHASFPTTQYSVDTGRPARLYAFWKKKQNVIRKVDAITLITQPVGRHDQVISLAPSEIVSELLNPELGIIRRSCFGDLRSHFLHYVPRIKIRSTP
jgi:hypothetical protein